MQEGVEVSHSSQLLTPARVCDEPVLEQEAELKAQCVVARESDCRRETGDPQHEQDQLSHEADGVSLEGHGHGKGMSEHVCELQLALGDFKMRSNLGKGHARYYDVCVSVFRGRAGCRWSPGAEPSGFEPASAGTVRGYFTNRNCVTVSLGDFEYQGARYADGER
eukprot:766482-Hanusia_phi.AAC.12